MDEHEYENQIEKLESQVEELESEKIDLESDLEDANEEVEELEKKYTDLVDVFIEAKGNIDREITAQILGAEEKGDTEEVPTLKGVEYIIGLELRAVGQIIDPHKSWY